MTRARAAWLAGGLLAVAALGYLLRRRSRRVEPVGTHAPVPVRAATRPVVQIPTPVATAIQEPIEEDPQVRTEPPDAVDNDEQPLATWLRVAIVAVALLAFFAVSLIATKQV